MKHTLLPLLLALAAVFFSHSLVVLPLWLLVTALHEACHGLAAVVLGGHVTSYHVNMDAGGWCGYTIVPSLFRTVVVAGAGYTGSVLIGGSLLVVAARSRHDRWFLAALGALLVFLSLLCLTSASWFGTAFCAATGTLFLVLAKLPLGNAHDFLLRLVGLSCAFMGAWDIKDDLVDRTVSGSDGDVIAQTLHLPPFVVGVIWLSGAVVLILLFLRWSVQHERGAA